MKPYTWMIIKINSIKISPGCFSKQGICCRSFTFHGVVILSCYELLHQYTKEWMSCFLSSWSQGWRARHPLDQQWWAGTRMERHVSWLALMLGLTWPAPSRPLLTCWTHQDLLCVAPAGGRVWLLPPFTAVHASTVQGHTPVNASQMLSFINFTLRAPPAPAQQTGSTTAPMTSTQSSESTFPSEEMENGEFSWALLTVGMRILYIALLTFL